LALLDVGCGSGVMSGHLRRYGQVTAIDWSEPAVALGRKLAPDVRFLVGTVDDLPRGETFDVIAAFDVLEHIPRAEHAAFFAQVDARLAADGQLILSTPHPRLTAWIHAEAPERAQVIEESVELAEVVELGRQHGLELASYETYEIEFSGPQYQFIALARAHAAGTPLPWPNTRFAETLRWRLNRPARLIRRTRLVLSCLIRARWDAATWLLGRRRRDASDLEAG
jgi:SAM-dependent methyltransferase